MCSSNGLRDRAPRDCSRCRLGRIHRTWQTGRFSTQTGTGSTTGQTYPRSPAGKRARNALCRRAATAAIAPPRMHSQCGTAGITYTVSYCTVCATGYHWPHKWFSRIITASARDVDRHYWEHGLDRRIEARVRLPGLRGGVARRSPAGPTSPRRSFPRTSGNATLALSDGDETGVWPLTTVRRDTTTGA